MPWAGLQVSEMRAQQEQMSSSLSESQQKKQQLETELSQLQESSKSEISQLLDRLEDKTKAGLWYGTSFHKK